MFGKVLSCVFVHAVAQCARFAWVSDIRRSRAKHPIGHQLRLSGLPLDVFHNHARMFDRQGHLTACQQTGAAGGGLFHAEKLGGCVYISATVGSGFEGSGACASSGRCPACYLGLSSAQVWKSGLIVCGERAQRVRGEGCVARDTTSKQWRRVACAQPQLQKTEQRSCGAGPEWREPRTRQVQTQLQTGPPRRGAGSSLLALFVLL
eukprot:gnl/Chilomastix_cuspidata/7278.p2 GENE.gnl/Chilomastix_cuspidata/7278~~gnl/Chilomastix_cuspidata/7278.p2  ORF type:complete len:206 (+),score=5.79 gnl/Chilomastix_cuspidata/7278:806-1423(+)